MPPDPTQPYDPDAELATAISDSDTLTNDDLSRILRERFSTEQGESGEGEESSATPPPATEPTEPTPTPSPEPPTVPELIDFGEGLTLTKDQAKEYAEFAAFLEANPEYAELAKKAFESTATPPAPEPQPIPEELDLDDPTIKALWDRMQEQDSRLKTALDQIAALDTYATTQTAATTESLVNRGVASFQKQYNLSDAEVAEIRQAAARLEILPALMAPLDPITGQARKVDPLAAIETSLETAMYAIPSFRERAFKLQLEQKQAEDTRKRNLSKLGGSSGSVPRTTPVPTTPQERQKAMIAELSEAIYGPSQSNEES